MNFEDRIILENSRVRLEPLNESHFKELLPIVENYPNLLQLSPSPFGTPEKLKENIEIAINGRIEKQRYPFVIFDKQKHRYVGSTSFGSISVKDKRIEIGWTWLDKEVQGSGINFFCKHLLLKYAFEVLEYERVELKTDSRNLQSRKAIEKIGAKFEGELRSHTVMPDGFRRNTVYYSILKDEWKAIEDSVFKEFR